MAASWDSFFVSSLWINNSFPADLYKRWLLAAGPACPLTVSWVNPPDSHCSITVHLSGRGHGRQLSHSLQIKSMSDPSWASCLQGKLWIYKKSSLWYPLAAYVSDWCVCLCVCARGNRIKAGPCPPWELSIWFYMLSDKVRRLWHICISRCWDRMLWRWGCFEYPECLRGINCLESCCLAHWKNTGHDDVVFATPLKSCDLLFVTSVVGKTVEKALQSHPTLKHLNWINKNISSCFLSLPLFSLEGVMRLRWHVTSARLFFISIFFQGNIKAYKQISVFTEDHKKP